MDSICNRCGHYDDRTRLCCIDRRRTTQRVNCPHFVWYDLLRDWPKGVQQGNDGAPCLECAHFLGEDIPCNEGHIPGEVTLCPDLKMKRKE